MSYKVLFPLSPSLHKSPVTANRPVFRGHAPPVPQVHTRTGPNADPNTNGLQQPAGHPNRVPSVPRWLDSWNLTCDIMMTSSPWLKRALVYMYAHAQSNHALKRHTGWRNCYLSWVGVYWKMCFSCSLSHQPQQTGLLSMQLSTVARDNRLSAMSSFHLSLFFIPPFPFLPSCILFYCLPEFPSCNNRYFPPIFFLCISWLFHWSLPCFWPVSHFSLCLISSVLSNGSLGSFLHHFSFTALSIQPYASFLSLCLIEVQCMVHKVHFLSSFSLSLKRLLPHNTQNTRHQSN